jgi:hypothetical protein
MTSTKLLLGQMLIVFAVVIGGVWFATQWAAAFVILHCTGGDLLILAASLMLALLLIGDANWPHFGYRWVASRPRSSA